MPFATQSGYLDDEERRRQEQAAIAQQSQQAVSQTNDALGRAEALAEKDKEGQEQQQRFDATLAQQKDTQAANVALQQQALAQNKDKADADYRFRLQEANNQQVRTNLEHFDNEAKLRMTEAAQKDTATRKDKAWTEYVKSTHLPVFIQGFMDKDPSGEFDDNDIAQAAKDHLGIDVDPMEVRGMRYALGKKSDKSDLTDEATQAKIDEMNARAAKEQRAASGAGGKKKKTMGAKDIDSMISTPQHTIDTLGDMIGEIPQADTGARKTAEDAAEGVPIIGENIKGAIQSENQAGFDAQVDSAVAMVNNAMDRRVNEHTLNMWKKRIKDAARQGPVPYQKAVAAVQAEMQGLLNQRKQDLSQGGYDVPGGGSASAMPQQGGLDTKDKRAARTARINELLRLATE